ncbi:hypothetical protein D3C72_1620330 [compost metagenome]
MANIGYSLHDRQSLLRNPIEFILIGTHDPELDRERRVRTKHKLGDADGRFRNKTLRNSCTKAMLQFFTSVGIGCEHDDLGEGRIR